jgi:hypothetical protein
MESTSSIQFYADKTGQYINKLFSFKVADRTEAFKVLLHFHCHKNRFRAIFYKTIVSIGNYKTSYSEELIPEYNFFLSYNSSHFPTLADAQRDFEIWKIPEEKNEINV